MPNRSSNEELERKLVQVAEAHKDDNPGRGGFSTRVQDLYAHPILDKQYLPDEIETALKRLHSTKKIYLQYWALEIGDWVGLSEDSPAATFFNDFRLLVQKPEQSYGATI